MLQVAYACTMYNRSETVRRCCICAGRTLCVHSTDVIIFSLRQMTSWLSS